MWWCAFLTVEILLSYSQEFDQHNNTSLHVFAYKACRTTPSSAQALDTPAADCKEKLAAAAAEAAAAANRRTFYQPEISANCLLCVLQHVIALSSLTRTRLRYILSLHPYICHAFDCTFDSC